MISHIRRITRWMLLATGVVIGASLTGFGLLSDRAGLWGAALGGAALALTALVTVAYLRWAARNLDYAPAGAMLSFLLKMLFLGAVLLVGRSVEGINLQAAGATFGAGLLLVLGLEVWGLANPRAGEVTPAAPTGAAEPAPPGTGPENTL